MVAQPCACVLFIFTHVGFLRQTPFEFDNAIRKPRSVTNPHRGFPLGFASVPHEAYFECASRCFSSWLRSALLTTKGTRTYPPSASSLAQPHEVRFIPRGDRTAVSRFSATWNIMIGLTILITFRLVSTTPPALAIEYL